MLSILFVTTRMYALLITNKKGAPQAWVQDGMIMVIVGLFVMTPENANGRGSVPLLSDALDKTPLGEAPTGPLPLTLQAGVKDFHELVNATETNFTDGRHAHNFGQNDFTADSVAEYMDSTTTTTTTEDVHQNDW